MFVYIWKTPDGVPFYVGCTNSTRRTNPKNSPKRNWLCAQKLNEVGKDHVVVELRFVDSIVDGQALERKLIEEYGRIQTGTGTLTNLMPGGEGVSPMTEENKRKRREAFLSPDSPIRRPESVAKRNAAIKARMNTKEVKLAMSGNGNPAKKPEVREKLKAIWEDPEYKARQTASRTGLKKNFSDEDRADRAVRLKANPSMKGWGDRNGKDPEFDAKRIAGIRAAQGKRLATMSDPEKKAARIAKLKETMASKEYKAKRAQWDTPEYREKLAAAKREYWAKKHIEKSTQAS